MKYFFDTEFCERGNMHPIELISIGIVCEDGREYYAVNHNVTYIAKHVNEWVQEMLLKSLMLRIAN